LSRENYLEDIREAGFENVEGLGRKVVYGRRSG
jgi:hypothetical protein